ncbi:imidazole glycerol phosphate synthase amidotransferase subunit [hydrocarbon metagenome]|uniref:Imidazole glycerol phosphate synthase amidotransferase subunit n=1 Tax=hydrocarbon metagenome TaxID=938273 RepID=A0A0W8FYQ1_9ZZZZ
MVAIIEYCINNASAISNALSELEIDHVITKSEVEIIKADKIILTGSENFHLSVKMLHLLNLFTQLRVIKKPILGISHGMQILCNHSDEGDTSCLGIIDTESKKFDETEIKTPHIGLSKIKYTRGSKLFEGIENDSSFFYHHSYYIPQNKFTVATSNYGVEFSAAFEKDRLYGVQFHPEKSGEVGLRLIKNFVELC